MSELERSCIELKKLGIDLAVITSIENVAYLCGCDVPLPIGPLACIGKGMPLFLVMIDVAHEDAVLIASAEYRAQIEASCLIEHTHYFTVFGNLNQSDAALTFKIALDASLRDVVPLKSSRLTIGLEDQSCPLLVSRHVQSEYPQAHFAEISSALESARRIKTPREIEKLRDVASVLDAGQEAFNSSHAQSAVEEFAVYEEVVRAMTRAAGRILPISGELVIGERTCEVKWPGRPPQRPRFGRRLRDSRYQPAFERLLGRLLERCSFRQGTLDEAEEVLSDCAGGFRLDIEHVASWRALQRGV